MTAVQLLIFTGDQTNTAVTLKPVIMQGTAFSRMEWKSINCMKKLVQIQTDIIFLSKCKQMDIVPKGLKINQCTDTDKVIKIHNLESIEDIYENRSGCILENKFCIGLSN
ncbi:hypothetical protein UY3_04228 [Chelonia mydas]|uniref:Uncharacterized protein n=1 Tax=Chelonia mydas TaxID=8469 RepID=M7BMW7_CHEMY|nr:hypothetical protein UY3_04228 [Chelonia mydas]